jgi:hypothetical protein
MMQLWMFLTHRNDKCCHAVFFMHIISDVQEVETGGSGVWEQALQHSETLTQKNRHISGDRYDNCFDDHYTLYIYFEISNYDPHICTVLSQTSKNVMFLFFVWEYMHEKHCMATFIISMC